MVLRAPRPPPRPQPLDLNPCRPAARSGAPEPHLQVATDRRSNAVREHVARRPGGGHLPLAWVKLPCRVSSRLPRGMRVSDDATSVHQDTYCKSAMRCASATERNSSSGAVSRHTPCVPRYVRACPGRVPWGPRTSGTTTPLMPERRRGNGARSGRRIKCGMVQSASGTSPSTVTSRSGCADRLLCRRFDLADILDAC